jgi:hypothetical protein
MAALTAVVVGVQRLQIQRRGVARADRAETPAKGALLVASQVTAVAAAVAAAAKTARRLIDRAALAALPGFTLAALGPWNQRGMQVAMEYRHPWGRRVLAARAAALLQLQPVQAGQADVLAAVEAVAVQALRAALLARAAREAAALSSSLLISVASDGLMSRKPRNFYRRTTGDEQF